MKLSFSIKGWKNYRWADYCNIACELGFFGVELHNTKNKEFRSADNPFDPANSFAIVRDMINRGLTIPCLDAACNVADISSLEENCKEIEDCIRTARNLKIPYVRVHAGTSIGEGDMEMTVKCLEQVLPAAEKADVTLLLETVGLFAKTEKLRDVLNHFASDSLGALWDMYHTCFSANEAPDITIKNLGAYVKHVHVKDSKHENGEIRYCLMGEGELPMADMMNALRAVNYDGFISLEWDPMWLEDIDDIEVIFSHFVSYMHHFEDPKKNKKTLYSNKLHTGKFLWKKESLLDMTFPKVLDAVVEEFPDQIAFKYTTLDYTRTYSEFRDDVDTFARALISLGVKPGHHVAVWATNVPQWYIAFWATTKIGAVLVTMNTAYKIHEAEYLLRQSDTHTLITVDGWRDSDYNAIIGELCPELENTKAGEPLHCKRLPFLRNVITVGFRKDGCLTWDEAIQRAPKVPIEEVHRRAAAVEADDVCNMQYTSGTTGFPKGVMLTHYNVVNNGKCIGDRMDLSTADRMMIQVPMFHCFGMVLSMTASMTHGASLYPLPYFSPKSALACVNDEHITCFNGVPTMFIAMFNHDDYKKTDFSYMRTGIMAGANCPADLMRRAAQSDEMNMRGIVSVYGQTEASPGCTMSELDDPIDDRCDTVGYAFPHVECKIIDPETGEELPNGENGEFVARGYNIMKGYYKMPNETKGAIDSNGWLHTGDIACRDDNGNYRITGRLKDMIIRGGENIYPKEIEEFIYTCPKVRDVQVIGVPDERYGEEIMACIILKDGEEMTVEEMKEYILAHMARHKVPKYIDFVKAFPMNAAGKILKYKMREDAVEKLGLKK